MFLSIGDRDLGLHSILTRGVRPHLEALDTSEHEESAINTYARMIGINQHCLRQMWTYTVTLRGLSGGRALGRLSPGSLDRFYLIQTGCGP